MQPQPSRIRSARTPGGQGGALKPDQHKKHRATGLALLSGSERRKAGYVALSTFATDQGLKRWPLKPKFHLFQEQSSSSPSETWTYRDEGWGGVMATWSFRRGGHDSPAAMANSLFDRFAAQDMPRL